MDNVSVSVVTYTVPTAGSAASVPGSGSVTAGGACRQPLVVVALHRDASMTETSLVTWFAVYSVWVSGSRATDSGSSPVWMVGG